jgi:hypothetical protein
MNVYLGAGLVSIWLLCLGITLARSSSAGQPSTPSATAEPQAVTS